MRKNFLKQEFIGLPVRVVECSDTTMKGMEGEIIDETKNMLVAVSYTHLTLPTNREV